MTPFCTKCPERVEGGILEKRRGGQQISQWRKFLGITPVGLNLKRKVGFIQMMEGKEERTCGNMIKPHLIEAWHTCQEQV
jgi:hypothetical protein